MRKVIKKHIPMQAPLGRAREWVTSARAARSRQARKFHLVVGCGRPGREQLTHPAPSQWPRQLARRGSVSTASAHAWRCHKYISGSAAWTPSHDTSRSLSGRLDELFGGREDRAVSGTRRQLNNTTRPAHAKPTVKIPDSEMACVGYFYTPAHIEQTISPKTGY